MRPELLAKSKSRTCTQNQIWICFQLCLVGVATQEPSERNWAGGLHTAPPLTAIKAGIFQAKENDKKRHHKK